MRKNDIEISIGPDGDVSFTVKGVKGSACLDETKFLEEAAGGGVLAQEKTSEFYEAGRAAGAQHWVGEDDDD